MRLVSGNFWRHALLFYPLLSYNVKNFHMVGFRNVPALTHYHYFNFDQNEVGTVTCKKHSADQRPVKFTVCSGTNLTPEFIELPAVIRNEGLTILGLNN